MTVQNTDSLERFINGKDLREMRHEAGLTTVAMAEFAKVKTRKTYENWEKNIGSPSINQFILLMLGCNQKPHLVIEKFQNKVI